jgi:hypothetical protein
MNRYPNVRDLERIHGVAWLDLAEREPKLPALLWRAREAGASCRQFSDVAQVFSPIRNTLSELVGLAAPCSRHPVLGSVGAYEVAYWKLYDAVAGMLPRPVAVAEKPTENP